MESSFKYIEYTESKQGGESPTWGLAWGYQLNIKNNLVKKCQKEPQTWMDSLDEQSKLKKLT
jgi:hypothetical protein